MKTLLEHLSQNTKAVAISDGNSGSYTASTLSATVSTLADRLLGLGVSRIALYADNSPAWIIADIACQQADITLLPLPLFFSAEQLKHSCDIASVQGILTDRSALLRQHLNTASPQPFNNHFEWLPLDVQQLAPLPRGTAKITFTSGSTGAPKGVCLSTEQQLRVAESVAKRINIRGLRHLCLLPLTTLLENVAGVYAPLMNHGEVIVPPLRQVGLEGSSGLDITALKQAIDDTQPNSMILLPETLGALVDAIDGGWQAPKSLQFVAIGGARVASRLLQRANHIGIPVYQGYGLSECASVVALNTFGEQREGTVGGLLDHLSATTENGEIIIRGNSFLGYIGEPDSWYPSHIATGDLGSIDSDGFITIDGRSKNLLISSFGRNINPEWLESELLANPNIAQAVVIGDDRPFCSALLFLRHSQKATDVAHFIATLNQRLPDYARIHAYQFLPTPLSYSDGNLTENGRLRRDRIQLFYRNDIEQFYAAKTPIMNANAISTMSH